jgi:hypothetical protein
MASDRTDFLREYYRVLTDDIRRSETIIPQVCGLELAVMVLWLLTRWWNGPIASCVKLSIHSRSAARLKRMHLREIRTTGILRCETKW